MTKFKSKLKKATIIPALCMMASVLPTNAKANGWGAFANFISGAGTGLTALQSSQRQAEAKRAREPQVVYTNGGVYPANQEQIVYVGNQQPAQHVYIVEEQAQPAQQPVRKIVRRRIVTTTTTTTTTTRHTNQQVQAQPVIEEIIIEEVPVQTSQQQPVRYITNQGR
jgi:hypothetical protein